jgi:hypothetical protein
MEHTEKKKPKIPSVRIDIMFYWMFIVYLVTRLYLAGGDIQMLKAHVDFVDNKLLAAMQETNKILYGPSSNLPEYQLPDTKPDKAK